MGVGLYCQASFGVSSLGAARQLPSNQTEYPSNHFARSISLHQNNVQTWGLAYTVKQPLEYRHWELSGHSLATKQSTLATVLQDLYL